MANLELVNINQCEVRVLQVIQNLLALGVHEAAGGLDRE